tara:strand:+ start:2390 stop:2773 length:384 start_codon:yes stop_codon:yes gene_type:complete
MPLVYTNDYDIEFISLNPHMACMYVESRKEMGGGRMLAVLRGHLKGIPVTLRENYAAKGHLIFDTQSRDKATLLKQFKDIQQKLWGQTVICLPIIPFQKELENLEKHSPEVAKMLSKRMEYIKETFS